MSRRPFDGFEVRVVGEFAIPGSDEHYCEPFDSQRQYEEAKDEAHAVFYTVYGVRGWGDDPDVLLPDGGAEAIADFATYDPAMDLAYALADGKEVVDMVPRELQRLGLE